jgi:pimeloyl-ACP methyl ester carboxylesterase
VTFEAEPRLRITAADGASLAVFAVATEPVGRNGAGPPLLLVHGTASDHTTWRVVGPLLRRRRMVFAMDRRGRGASGDGRGYAIEREFDDVAAVASGLAGPGGTVDVVGHSYGGRCALGASLRTARIRRVVCYEGAPTPEGVSFGDRASLTAVQAAVREGDLELALETFFRAVVEMDDAQIEAYRADPVWPVRVAAAATIAREAEAEGRPGAGLEVLGRVGIPVLQILGSASVATFALATAALDARLRDGRVVEIEGAAHAAHHTHPAAFVRAVEDFLDG